MNPPASGNSQRDIAKAVVPAAGLGTRLRPLTPAIPKEMLPIGRKPVLAHVVEELQLAGIREVLFVVSDAKPQIRDMFGDRYQTGLPGFAPVKCSYTIQHEQLGLGHAISLAREWTAGEDFVVAFGDCIIESARQQSPLQRLIATHRSNSSNATTLVEKVPDERVSRYGIVKPCEQMSAASDDGFELEDVIEKPLLAEAPSRFAVAARWALSQGIFEHIAGVAEHAADEINLTDAVRRLKRAGGSFWATPLRAGEFRRDIGNFGTFFDAFVRAAMRDSEYGGAIVAAIRKELETDGVSS